jgi:hypothetical protein
MELEKLGLNTHFIPIKIEEALEESVWQGVKNKYWHLGNYFLPECRMEQDPISKKV